MSNNLTGEDVLAGRFYLKITQAKLSVDLGLVGLTTINRWENEHSAPSGAWSKIADEYFTRRIGKDWKTKVRTSRFKALLSVRKLAAKHERKVRINPSHTEDDLLKLRRRLYREAQE